MSDLATSSGAFRIATSPPKKPSFYPESGMFGLSLLGHCRNMEPQHGGGPAPSGDTEGSSSGDQNKDYLFPARRLNKPNTLSVRSQVQLGVTPFIKTDCKGV